MAKGPRPDPGREARWREILRQQAESGLSIRAFCRREGLSEHTVYAWRRTLRQRDARRQLAGQAGQADAAQRGQAGPAFVPVVVDRGAVDTGNAAAESTSASITIELRGGRLMRLPASIPAAQVAGLVDALERIGGGA